eukprot:3539421-Prymnesium_polylepis.1
MSADNRTSEWTSRDYIGLNQSSSPACSELEDQDGQLRASLQAHGVSPPLPPQTSRNIVGSNSAEVEGDAAHVDAGRAAQRCCAAKAAECNLGNTGSCQSTEWFV